LATVWRHREVSLGLEGTSPVDERIQFIVDVGARARRASMRNVILAMTVALALVTGKLHGFPFNLPEGMGAIALPLDPTAAWP
jgi:hypothetical protein